jgi:uncharacterized protein
MTYLEKISFFIREHLRLLIGLVVVILIFIFVISLIVNNSDKKVTQVQLNDQVFKVQIAKTDQEKQIGLSNTKKLPQDQGMLFLFSNPGFYSFWMKEMKFPIDIIYINGNRVTTIIKNALPPSDSVSLTTYQPKEKSDKVLEVNAGLADKYNIREGSVIKIENL